VEFPTRVVWLFKGGEHVQIKVTNFRKGEPISVEPMSHPDFGLCGAQCTLACNIACVIDAVAVATTTAGGTAGSVASYPFDSGDGDEGED
jgi:hypothetical protein